MNKKCIGLLLLLLIAGFTYFRTGEFNLETSQETVNEVLSGENSIVDITEKLFERTIEPILTGEVKEIEVEDITLPITLPKTGESI